MSEDELARTSQPEPLPQEQAPQHDNHSRGVSLIREQFAGPLPHPSILAQYDHVVPGAAERIIKMAEDQATHRRDLESRVIRNDVTNSRLGMIFAFILGLVGISLPAFVKSTASTWISIASLASLVGVFITGTHKRNQERKARRQEAGEEEED